MKKAFAIVIIGLIIVFGGIFGFKAFINHMIAQKLGHMPLPTYTVSAAKARTEEWHPHLQAVASLDAVQGTALSTQIAGNVTGIYFKSGQDVPAGTLLIQIDNSNQLAQLANDKASLHLASVNLKRTQELIATKAASQAQLDQAQATYAADQALVRNDQATLNKLGIRAPFSGHLGIRKVNVGQYVTPGTEIVDLQSWNPLYVNFTLPQADLPELSTGTPVQFSTDALPGQTFTARITALGSAVDASTRQIAVQATVENGKNLLRPGMFGDAVVVRNQQQKVLTVPASAITYNTYGDYVYLIHNEQQAGKTVQVATQTVIKTGRQRDGQVEVLSGLKAGDLVVTAGQVKLSNNSKVSVQKPQKD